METKFQNIGIIGNRRTVGIAETVLVLIDFLKAKQVNILLEDATAKLLKINHEVTVLPHSQLGEACDLLVVVGGDGCMLSAARIAVLNEVPIVGINRGKLGFLTDIRPDEIDSKMQEILRGQYLEEKRFLLEAKSDDKRQESGELALNDVVLTTGATAQMIGFEIYINDKFMCSQRADGMIIATPTGSTAYALSGGGPILHPGLDAVVIVPMFSHGLTNRPIVIDANSEIRIDISTNNKTPPRFTCDGKAYISVALGHSLYINKFQRQLKLIHPCDYNYFKALRSKLYWGQKIIQ